MYGIPQSLADSGSILKWPVPLYLATGDKS